MHSIIVSYILLLRVSKFRTYRLNTLSLNPREIEALRCAVRLLVTGALFML